MDPITGTLVQFFATQIFKQILKNRSAILGWFKNLITGIVDIFKRIEQGVYHAIEAYAEMINSEMATFRNKLYYQENYSCIEEVQENYLNQSEIPNWVREKVQVGQGESEITSEIQHELRMTF